MSVAQRLLELTWSRAMTIMLEDHPRPQAQDTVHAAGPDPDQVLVLGGGVALGVGVLEHELAVSGHLARELAATTRRGAVVRVEADQRLTFEGALARVRAARLDRYDAVVLCVGEIETARRTSLETVRVLVDDLVLAIRAATTPETSVLFVGVRPIIVPDDPVTTAFLRQLHDRARAVNSVIEQVGVTRGVGYAAPLEVSGQWFSASHHAWGRLLASHLAPALTGAATGAFARRRPDDEQDEVERQSALDALGILDTAPDPEIDRLVKLACGMFGTRFAAVQLIDRSRAWTKAAYPEDQGIELPRDETFCTVAIERPLPLVVGDARADPRFSDLPRVRREGGIRFYAGHPLEAPDGSRIGALCIYDTEPRNPDEVDLSGLRTLAIAVQRRLNLSARRAVR